MPIIHEITPELFEWLLSRVMLSGPPNSGKTGSSVTFGGPQHLLSYPGEGGINSIPKVDFIKPYIWQDNPASRASSQTVINEILQVTTDIITGKNGPCDVFFGDGVHRFYEYFVDVATGGDYFKGKVKDKGWLPVGQAKVAFKEYLKMVKAAPNIKVVVFTCWDGAELDRSFTKDATDLGGPKHIMPGFVGQMAKEAMGEFSLILSCHRDVSPVTGKGEFWWQIIPQGDVMGAQIKIDPARMERIMANLKGKGRVPQDWQKLRELLLTA